MNIDNKGIIFYEINSNSSTILLEPSKSSQIIKKEKV